MHYLTMLSPLTAILHIFHSPKFPNLLLHVTKIPWRLHRPHLLHLLLEVILFMQGGFFVHHLPLARGSFHHYHAVLLALEIFPASHWVLQQQDLKEHSTIHSKCMPNKSLHINTVTKPLASLTLTRTHLLRWFSFYPLRVSSCRELAKYETGAQNSWLQSRSTKCSCFRWLSGIFWS